MRLEPRVGRNRRPAPFRGDRAITHQSLLKLAILGMLGLKFFHHCGEVVVFHRTRKRGNEVRPLRFQGPQRLKGARVEPAACQMREVSKEGRSDLRVHLRCLLRGNLHAVLGRILNRHGVERAGKAVSVGRIERLHELAIPLRRAVAVNPDQLVILILIDAPYLIDEPRTLCGRHLRPCHSGVQRLPINERLQRGVRLRLRVSPRAAAGSCAAFLAGGGEYDERHERECIDPCTRTSHARQLCKNRTHFAPRGAEMLH